ncbi:DEAD/DEAH box helicase [Aliarcobacter cibarius]|uniref:DEAD/DEAH box helicase n=1 Tax=Aliarcobacter cibarius TaxID=255507 RepID=A0ABY2V3Z5_9BACT|nr:DEAD/DEAH box helicase [Aliarcobacter cibarius]TLS96201.1 DEAD/DEAH box helicase [Aliarcobacter cibarius]TLS96804.1 DEAD/DEAH box helicase [Aliarcobacter cibarius]TLT02938.1 DEAD/DEAH box helicase [Aliarcobacter cibarius]
MKFSEFIVCDEINQSLKENNYKTPTLIQSKVIKAVFEKVDVIAKAQTGSGKTASFVLPILELFSKQNDSKKAKIKTLVLTPTRELALQISDTFEIFSKYLNKKPKIVSLIGGEGISKQLIDVQKGCDIVVATTGRLIDILEKKQINLNYLEFFILDEADKMLDFGFEEELDNLLKIIPSTRQNLLFSATYPDKVKNIISRITQNPVYISIEEPPVVENINQRVILVNKEKKSLLLRELISENKWDKILVFVANKRSCDNIAFKFRKNGLNAISFHSDLTQEERNNTLKNFKENKINILFATDIVSRGIHVEDISCVINFDLPRASEDYIHRIGRTARAGKTGVAISFIGLEDFEHFSLIEKRCNISIKKEQIKDFELIGSPVKKEKGLAPIKGKRKSKKDKLRELAKKDA